MKNRIFEVKNLLILLIFIYSCDKPILNKNEYKIYHILKINRGGFNNILSYNVIINYDGDFYYAELNADKELNLFNPRKIKLNK